MASWKCSRCGRTFTRENQRHACGTGDLRAVLRNRPEHVVRLYGALEQYVRSFGPIEIVARDRYVLLRSTRIFADLVLMSDALRVAVHVPRRLSDPVFVKVVSDGKKVTHVAKLTTERELEAVRPSLREAYDWSLAATSGARGARAGGRP